MVPTYSPPKLDPDALPVYIDRTALELFWQCPRKFYWARRYRAQAASQHGGVPVLGLEPAANEHRAFGKLMHAMVEEACQTPSQLPTASALGAKVSQALMAELAAASPNTSVLKEYLGLSLGLAHQLVTHILPVLLAEHTIVAIEQELLLPLPPRWVQLPGSKQAVYVQLGIRVKPDLILQHKADGQLVYFEWKTTSFTGTDQLTAFEINPQLQLGMAAVAQAYGHCDWAQVGLFYKGQKRNGLRTSPFCYGYVCADGRISTSYVKGWFKTPLADLLQQHDADMNWWVKQMSDEQEQGLFWITAPIFQNAIQQAGIKAQVPSILDVILHADEAAYHQSFGACTGAFGQTCGYHAACYLGQQDSQYTARVPHHAPKVVVLYGSAGQVLHAAV